MSWMVSGIQWTRPLGSAVSAAATITSRCRENWELARSARGPAATTNAGTVIRGKHHRRRLVPHGFQHLRVVVRAQVVAHLAIFAPSYTMVSAISARSSPQQKERLAARRSRYSSRVPATRRGASRCRNASQVGFGSRRAVLETAVDHHHTADPVRETASPGCWPRVRPTSGPTPGRGRCRSGPADGWRPPRGSASRNRRPPGWSHRGLAGRGR